MFISAVVPLFNKARYIKRALDSVLAQTFQDFEVVVVNDGSTDGSEKVVEWYTDPRVRMVHREHVNSWGGHAARNRGIAEAHGDLVAFLDADDEWLPGHLLAIDQLARKYPECGAYCTNSRTVGTDGRVRAASFTFLPATSSDGVLRDYFRQALVGFPVHSSKVAVPTKVFEECGLFPEGEQEGGDLDMWCRIALKYTIAYSAEVGAIYHTDSANRIGRKGYPAIRRRLVETLEHALETGEYHQGIDRSDLAEYLYQSLIIRAARNIQGGDRQYGRELLSRAARTKRFRGRYLRWKCLSYLPAPLLKPALGLRQVMTFFPGTVEDTPSADAGLLPSGESSGRRGVVCATATADAGMLSVVIPLHNKVRYIKRALDSVLAQTHREFEVVVVDDGSTDGSEKVVEGYADPRVRLICQQNMGVSAARNRGIGVARSDFVAFLDADDEWLPTHLETILRLRRRFPQCGAYATAFRVVTPRGQRTPLFAGIPAPPFEGVIPNYFHTTRGSQAVCSSAVAVPKEVFATCGPFPEGEQRREDLDMWCRIALEYPIVFSTSVGAVYHTEAEGRALNTGHTQLLAEPKIVRTLESALAAETIPKGVTRADLAEYMNIQLITRAQSLVRQGYRREARRLLRKASSTRVHRGVLRSWTLLSRLPPPLVTFMLGVRRFLASLIPRGGQKPSTWT
jgi:glycosyltransferase involved in cell wall biosynthesis